MHIRCVRNVLSKRRFYRHIDRRSHSQSLKAGRWRTGKYHASRFYCPVVHIAVPAGARGIVMRILGDMAMVAWYAGEPGTSLQLNTEPFFLED